MLTTTQAIVLRTVKYGEQKLFVDLFTLAHGRLTMVASRPKQTARSRANLFQPLSILEVEFDMKPAVGMQRIRNARMAYAATSIPFDARKIAIALFLSEMLTYALRDEQQNQPLFAFLSHSIRWLDQTGRAFANFHIVMLLRLAVFLGISPNTDEVSPLAFLDLREGRFTPLRPSHPDHLPPHEAAAARQLLRLSFPTMHLFPLTRVQRNRVARVIINYYRLHLPSFPEPKSFEVVQEIFGTP